MLQDLHVLAIPTKTDFRGIKTREVAIFRGPFGWSEFSPFIEYSDQEAKNWFIAALEAAYRPRPDLKKERIKINATLPKVNRDQIKGILSLYPGAKVVKIKIDSFDSDRYLLDETLNQIPGAKIRLDINAGWSLLDALKNLKEFIDEYGNFIEYVEQPCRSLEDLKKLKSELDIKIAIDESIRKSLDADFTHVSESADFAIIKWQPLGGFSNCEKLVNRIGLPVIVSSALETGVGISYGLSLASHLGVDFACGLGTSVLLDSDILAEPLEIIDGEITVQLGEPNMELVARYVASDERISWWKQRIDRIIKLGGLDEYFN